MQGCVQGKTAEKSRTAGGSENRKGHAQNGTVCRKGHRKGRTEGGEIAQPRSGRSSALPFMTRGKRPMRSWRPVRTRCIPTACCKRTLWSSDVVRTGRTRPALRIGYAARDAFLFAEGKSPPTSICAMFVGGPSCRLPAFALCDAGIEPDVRRDGGALCALPFRLLTRSSIRS